jgi:hypothetical protein
VHTFRGLLLICFWVANVLCFRPCFCFRGVLVLCRDILNDIWIAMDLLGGTRDWYSLCSIPFIVQVGHGSPSKNKKLQ